jgi:hypothetical protein
VLLGSNNWYQSKVHLGFIAIAGSALVVAGGATVSVFKSSTSRPGAPGILTGESDSTFRASRPNN